MTTSSLTARGHWSKSGDHKSPSVVRFGQHILNAMAVAARRAADLDALAMLPQRYLDDAGISLADFGVSRTVVDPAYLRISPVAFAHSGGSRLG